MADPCNDDVAVEKVWVRRLRKGVYERRGLTRVGDPVRTHSYKYKSEDLVDAIDFGSKDQFLETNRSTESNKGFGKRTRTRVEIKGGSVTLKRYGGENLEKGDDIADPIHSSIT